MSTSAYILITAARNEARHIRATIQSVITQTQRPARWMIIDDGSTDETCKIIREYMINHPFIELLHVKAASDRNFGSKAAAVNAGYRKIQSIPHDWVGILDADVTFEPTYYETMIKHFEQDPRLGIAGGIVSDMIYGIAYRQHISTDWSVSGPIQMFRKKCWQEMGGYLPIRGGIDAAAEVMARMKGWTVHTFPEQSVKHWRQTGRQNHSTAGIFFHRGLEDYNLGYHPAFFLARSVRHIREKPVVIGGLLMLSGYIWAGVSRRKRTVSDPFVRYLRQEQIKRLCHCVHLRKDVEA